MYQIVSVLNGFIREEMMPNPFEFISDNPIIVLIFTSLIGSKILKNLAYSMCKIFYNKGLTESPPTNYPTEVYINNIRQDNVYSEYDFDYPENNVTLVYNQVNNMNCMFDSCSNITRIDFH